MTKRDYLTYVDEFSKMFSEGKIENMDLDCTKNALLGEIENMWEVDSIAKDLFTEPFEVEVHLSDLDGSAEDKTEEEITASARLAGITGAFEINWLRKRYFDDESTDNSLMYYAKSTEITPELAAEYKESLAKDLHMEATAFYRSICDLIESGKLQLNTSAK